MAINEIQRQAYLKAMGITPYFPRFVLPGAAPSRLCEWPQTGPGDARANDLPAEPEGSIAAKTTVALAQPAVASDSAPQVGQARKKPAIDLSFDSPPPAARADAKQARKQAEAAVQASPAAVDILPFKVALISFAGGLAVLDQLPVMGNGQLPPSHFRLLCNLLRGCGLPVPSEQALIKSFQWPLPLQLQQDDMGLEAARSALQAFIEQHCQEQEVKYLLLMGPALARQLYGEAGELGQGLQQFAGEHWQTLVTESLGQVLKVGRLKRGLWQSLRSLPPDVH